MQKTLQQLETRLIILQLINKKMEKPEVETSGFFCSSPRNVDSMGMLRKKKNQLSFFIDRCRVMCLKRDYEGDFKIKNK